MLYISLKDGIYLKVYMWTVRTYRLGEATLVHVGLKRRAALQSSSRVVHGAGGTDHSVCVGTGLCRGVWRVVAVPGVVFMVAASGRLGQTKCVIQQEMHLLPHLVDRGLRAQSGRA